MNVQELISTIESEMLKTDFLHELSSENKKIYQNKCGGKFEAVLDENKKYLIPDIGTLHFLFRGQTKEFIPCVPTLYRGNPTQPQIFVERMRLIVFKHLLNEYPIVEHFFKKFNFVVDFEGLGQHYGLKTSVLDLTSSLDVALFFATCPYDYETDSYTTYDDEAEHEAILYVFNPLFDNKPYPSIDTFMKNNIKPIGLQAFPRPGEQQGYALHLKEDESICCWMYRFTFTSDDSKYYYNMFNKGNNLWVKTDILISKVREIAQMTTFSFKIFDEAYVEYRPKGFSKTKLKEYLPNDIKLCTQADLPTFTEEETNDIINEWNNSKGASVASSIIRKSWNEPDTGIQGDYRTFNRIKTRLLNNLIADPDPLENAEFVNYNPEAAHISRKTEKDSGWVEYPKSFESLFGETFLEEKDWKIERGENV